MSLLSVIYMLPDTLLLVRIGQFLYFFPRGDRFFTTSGYVNYSESTLISR
jgi:hypothetical protein